MARHTHTVAKRRKPNPAERRRDLCDAAIQLLADDGAKGLSHLKVDRKAGVPDGTTSFYFRTREALLHAVADSADGSGDNPSPSLLSQVVIQAGSEPQLSRTRARYELAMQAARDQELAAILQQATDGFTKLHREILVHLMPHGAELESAVVEDLSNVTLTFINGLLLRVAHGDRIVGSPEQLDGILSAIAAGILKSPDKGRLTEAGGRLPVARRRRADPK